MEIIEKTRGKTRFPVVEQIRSEIKALGYTPLDDDELADMRQQVAAAVNDNAIEDSIRTPEEVALDDMLLDERAPDAVRQYASRRYIEITIMNGESLKGKVFPECPY